MFKGLESYGSDELLAKLKGKNPFFICTIATTATARIPNISGAGLNSELMEYTPAGDVELIVHGEVRCCDVPPQTTMDGTSTPTPAMITKAVLELTNASYLVANAGSLIKPDVPYIQINEKHGEDIRTGKAVKNPKKIFENSKLIAQNLSKNNDYLVIGESIPAGTTTALGVLTALGYDADFKVSGSTPKNPHNLKKDVVMEGIANANLKNHIQDNNEDNNEVNSENKNNKIDPFKAVEALGDPMIPTVSGMVMGSKVPVILAGGTQMTAVCAFIKAIDSKFDFSNICIATTKFVAKDPTSDIFNIAKQIGKINIHVVNPYFEKSSIQGLKNYIKGYVKEGVGAGGAMLMALLLGYSIDNIREKIEEICK
ncbi:MAG: TIGR00303 family protein [Methanobrevibacter sp.]|nr:TIGR00303 family protein [Methanobrevibacter sp.]